MARRPSRSGGSRPVAVRQCGGGSRVVRRSRRWSSLPSGGWRPCAGRRRLSGRAACDIPRRPWRRTQGSAPSRRPWRGAGRRRRRLPAKSAAGRTFPPPRFWRSWRRAWAMALRVVITTSSRQRSSRSASWGNRPRARPAHRLSKALNAASSSSLPASRPRPGPQPRSRQVDHPREIPLPQRLCGRRVAALHAGDPPRDRTFSTIWHESPLFG